MHYLIQFGSGTGVAENNLAQFSAVNGTVSADYSLPKGINHFLPGFGTRFEDLMSHFIGIYYDSSQMGQEL
ncbi:hypothetical protein ES703_111241 [subsurface metagenome]